MISSTKQDDSKAPGSCVILDFGSASLAEHSLRWGCLHIARAAAGPGLVVARRDLAVESLTVHTPIHLAAQGLRVPAECIALHGRKELIGICLVQISAQVGDEPLARCRVQAQALRGFDLVPAVPLGEASGEERGVRDSLAREEPKCCTVCVLRSPHRRHRQAEPPAP